MNHIQLIGPFTQLLTLDGLPWKGPIPDRKLEIIQNAGILIKDENIQQVGNYEEMRKNFKLDSGQLIKLEAEMVGLPGFIDPHTHMCFAGSRANDYALRIGGKSYLEIARVGGGIWQTVEKTREATSDFLLETMMKRSERLLRTGVTTAEVKSGYGLTMESELKMLRTINEVDRNSEIDLISTCLAAHITPRDYDGKAIQYLNFISDELLPLVKVENLSNRVDIFIEEGAFNIQDSLSYLTNAKNLGFDLAVHGDQFTPGGSWVAIEAGALSVDHLESSTDNEINALANSHVISTVLPGASLGLGMSFAPARKLLDAGNIVAIGSDWNPGSAPMGNLVVQAALLSASEKLTNAETFAGITFRAAKALNLSDRGVLCAGNIADIIAFPCSDYREILYHQGQLMPSLIIKKGNKLNV